MKGKTLVHSSTLAILFATAFHAIGCDNSRHASPVSEAGDRHLSELGRPPYVAKDVKVEGEVLYIVDLREIRTEGEFHSEGMSLLYPNDDLRRSLDTASFASIGLGSNIYPAFGECSLTVVKASRSGRVESQTSFSKINDIELSFSEERLIR